MKNNISTLIEKKKLAADIYKMTFQTESCEFTKPGQYLTMEFDNGSIIKSIPVAEYDSDRYTMVYRVNDEGTGALSMLELGDTITARTGLGEGFDLENIPDKVTVLGQSLAIPPLLGLVRELLIKGVDTHLILSYNTKEEMFMVENLRNLCNNLEVLTVDGSNGREGFCYDGIKKADYAIASAGIDVIGRITAKVEHGQFLVKDIIEGDRSIYTK